MVARRVLPLLAACLFAAGLGLAADKPSGGGKRDLAAEEKVRKSALKVSRQYAKDIDPLVKWCVERKLTKQAAEVVATIEKIAPDWKRLSKLKEMVSTAEASADSPAQADVQEFARKIKVYRENHADRTMKLAKECAKYGLYTRAYDLMLEVLELDPEHAQARKVLGYVKKDGRWVSKWEANMLKDHVLYKDKEGVVQRWVPKKDVKKWDEGLRPFAGGWLPEAEEIRKRQVNEYRAWSVESQHFEVRTGVSRAAAYEWGQFLEDYYDAFFRNFINFFDVEDGAKMLFDTKPLKKKHVILFLASENHYKQHVKAEHGNEKLLLESAGFFGPCGSQKMSHCYRSDNAEDVAVMLHEVTHQLFDETKEERSHGSKGNNWVVEGIASYIETWGKENGKWYPGRNVNHRRLQIAKQFLAENPGWSLGDFLAIGNRDFHETNRGLNYCLSEALAHFLMHYDGERYREDFVRFIAVYYEGKAQENSLYEHLQIEGSEAGRAATLEKQFKEYMAKLGEAAADPSDEAGEGGGADE